MKTIVALVLAFVAIVSASIISENEAWEQYSSFLKTHEKEYNTLSEFQSRFNIFKANLDKIQSLKQKHPLAKFSANKFADLTEAEFKSTYTGVSAGGKLKGFTCFGDKAIIPNNTLSAFDWRSKNAVTPVKDQSMCGSCWAFSTTGNVEGVLAAAGKTTKAQGLSEQQLVDCDHECNPDDVCDSGCDGGLMDNALRYVKKYGLEPEEKYAYKGTDGHCKYKEKDVAATIKNYVCLPQDENSMGVFTQQNGPLAIAINADPLQFYDSGILTPDEDDCDPDGLNHGVLIVGYGTEKKTDYWIVKNSWATSWGEKGYFRIKFGTNACGLASFAVSAVVA